ncbi:MAG: protein kinase domain-containing protein [Candidatus Villigracilaceae bacterium]
MQEGSLLGKRYQLLEQIGMGGMANVFRARDLMLERYVAIKVLRQDYSHIPTFEERFRQEARAAANLSHPNIVTVHDFGMDDGQLYIVMENVPGKDLKTLIRQRGRFLEAEAIPLMVQACAGVGYAHRAGLVHCDIKPHNLLVTPDQRLKVTDFGIARALATIHPEERTEVVWGSPQYFSPEQARGEAPSPASDVYSLGVVLYEMLSGSLPFVANTAEELARLHIEQEPVPLSEYLPDISPTLEQIVMKVLAKEPSARYRTADQFGRVLMSFGMERDLPPQLNLTPEAATMNNRKTASKTPMRPVYAPAPQPAVEPVSRPVTAWAAASLSAQSTDDSSLPEIDWVSVLLGLLALLAVGGLIPFWMWVYFVYYPPIR